MKIIENAASVIGFSLTMVGVILFWWINWILGLGFTIFVIAVIIWYLRTKKTGNTYLKDVARLMGCKFESGGFGYGRVFGIYKGRKIEVKINKDYDALRGLSGFLISSALLNSATGTLAGIRNFTSIKVEHNGSVIKPYKLDETTYVDKHFILHLPSSMITGMPACDINSLLRKIDKAINTAKKIENE